MFDPVGGPADSLLGFVNAINLKRIGVSSKLMTYAKISKPEVVEIGENCRICDFTFIYGGGGVHIGDYVDFQPTCVIWGGGSVYIGNRVSVGVGTVILTGTYTYKEGLKMVDGLSDGETKAIYGHVEIKDDVYIGAHCTVMSNITIGEGAIIGANSLVTKDIEPWTVVVGSPCREIAVRPQVKQA